MAIASPAPIEVASPTLLSDLRSEEGGAALISAVRLALLRDLRAGPLLGVGSLDDLRRSAVPSLDAISARTLLRIADELVPLAELPGGAAALASLGLARLAIAAAAPAAVRSSLVWAGVVPLAEMRRHARWGREAIEAAGLRVHRGSLPVSELPDVPLVGPRLIEELRTAPEADRIEAVNASLAELRRSWERVGRAIYRTGTIVASLDPDSEADAAILASVGMDRIELERLTGPVRLFGSAGPERLERLGIGALRSIAAMRDPVWRAQLVQRSGDLSVGPDELIEAVERVERPSAAPTPPPAPEAASSTYLRDDPDALCSFSLWLSDDSEAGPPFADALPPSLVEQLILRTSHPGELIWDPMAGSGVSAHAAARLGRRVIASDLIDPPIDRAVGVADVQNTPVPPEVTMVFLHLPTPMEVIYSERYGGVRRSGDLSGMDPEGHRRALSELIKRIAAEMGARTAIVLVLRPSRFKGHFYDWPHIGASLLEAAGLAVTDRIIAPLGPTLRAEAERRGGLRAHSRGESIPVVWEAVIARRESLR